MSIKSVLTLLCLCSILCKSSSLAFLEWGEKCKIQSVGGGHGLLSSEECDAGKGLVCAGEGACECTYKQRYSYDHTSKECRRRVGKPCQYIDVSQHGQQALDRLPFNLKCHQDAECVQLEIPVRETPSLKHGVVDFDKISMCSCKPGFIATSNFDACIIPPPQLDVVHIPDKPLKNKLDIRVPYYTE